LILAKQEDIDNPCEACAFVIAYMFSNYREQIYADIYKIIDDINQSFIDDLENASYSEDLDDTIS